MEGLSAGLYRRNDFFCGVFLRYEVLLNLLIYIFVQNYRI